MLKNILSIILLVVFTNFIVVPTAISLVENTVNISQVFDLGEEEKKESLEVQEIELTNDTDKELTNCNLGKESISEYFLKNYDSLSIQLPLPPPEHLTV